MIFLNTCPIWSSLNFSSSSRFTGTPLESCPAAEIPEEAQVRYAACQAASVTRQIPRWAMSGLLFVVFVVSIAAGIILWRRRRDNVKRKKRVGGAGDKEAKTKEPEAKTEPALLAWCKMTSVWFVVTVKWITE